MPIRINLLAEAQAAEEIRRKDPAKRAVWIAIVLVAIVLAWSSFLQAKIIVVNSTLNTETAKLESLTNAFTLALANRAKLGDAQTKMAALNRFMTNRFLEGPALNSLMRSLPDGIQILHLRTEQNFDEVKPTLNENGKVLKPGGAVEKIRLILDAKDASDNPGNQQINTVIQALAGTPYFKSENINTNHIQLRNLSSLPQLDPETGKPYYLFSLECSYPERVR